MENKIAAIVLTKNEELHIERCLKSIENLVSEIYVIDSGSNDKTQHICKRYDVKFFFNKFISHPEQFNYGLNLVRKANFQWVLKIDADEVFTPTLKKEISQIINKNDNKYNGLAIRRKVIFQGKILNFGGVTTTQLRVFKSDKGFCENIFMDEHIKVKGRIKYLKEPFFDYSLKSINWWIEKHNLYSNKEVINMLFYNKNYKNDKEYRLTNLNRLTRFLKKNVYLKAPIIIRAFLIFFFKYFFLLGFLDGRQGLIYSFLQSFWYRFLVDVKFLELKDFSKKNKLPFKDAIKPVLGIEFDEKY